MYVFIYKYTSPSSKSYIGQVIEKKGIKTRWKEHVNEAFRKSTRGSRMLNYAINKYGPENFNIECLCRVHHNIKDNAEKLCIAMFNTLAPNGYNLQKGGTYTEHCQETRNKRSISLKKLLQNPEKRLIWSNAKLGKSQGIKNNRKYKEDNCLPKYIRKIRGKYEGYVIDSHPLCSCKKFTSSKLTMGEKFKKANEYLEKLNISLK